jgi:hypothetical protein
MYELQRDSEGYVRFSEPMQMTMQQYEEVVEQLWVKAGIDVKKKVLERTFKEYDGERGVKPRIMRRWTDEERRHVLMTVEDECDAVGKELGRSGMSIFMRRAQLLAEFESWQMSDEGKLWKEKSREEQVKKFLKQESEVNG